MFDEFSFETLHHNAFRLTLKNYRLPVEIGALAEEHGHIELQETLVESIARRLLVNPRVAAVRVQSTKPEAYPNCDGLSAETFLTR